MSEQGAGGITGDSRLLEALNEHAGFYVAGGKLIEQGASPYQQYEVWETPQFGKLFRLDGYFMTSERDEFFYHENLIHVPALAHAGPRSALIIGGGDGGSAEELFKHPSMARVVLVELDAKVVDIARTHLQAVHRGALDDPRLELRIEDGLKYVGEIAPAAGERFDLIVLDLTDPIGPAEALYTETFFRDCKAILAEGGAITLHIGAPIYQAERMQRLLRNLRAVFGLVCPYFMYIPLYGSQWGMACASDSLDPRSVPAEELDARLRARALGNLDYYNGAVHHAQFALPNYLRELTTSGHADRA
ncbi:MAG: polyamine aminopropyltransferase [Rhodocyclaceae bacterium]